VPARPVHPATASVAAGLADPPGSPARRARRPAGRSARAPTRGVGAAVADGVGSALRRERARSAPWTLLDGLSSSTTVTSRPLHRADLEDAHAYGVLFTGAACAPARQVPV
jgi:hypothetical protein